MVSDTVLYREVSDIIEKFVITKMLKLMIHKEKFKVALEIY